MDTKACIGIDAWLGSGENHLLPQALVQMINTQGFHFLRKIIDPIHANILSQEWKGAQLLG